MIKNFFYLASMFFYINILGYVFHFLISRKLGPEGYGEFMVLYSFMLTLGFLSNVYPALVIKNVIENNDFRYEVFRFLRLFSLLSGVIIFLILISFTPLIKEFLHINNSFSLYIISFIALILFLESVEKGFLQTTSKFGIYSILNAAELTLRLIFAIILISLGFGVDGAISSTLFSMLILVFLLLWINGNVWGSIKKIPLKNITKSFFLTTPSGLFVYADDIFIKRIFDPVLAGYFASASLLGKAYIWFILTVFSVVFVKITENKERFLKYFLYFLCFVLISFLLLESLLYLIGEKFFLLLFGNKFANGYKILPIYVAATLPLLINLIIYSINISLEKIFKSIYVHLVLYYLGFIFINFSNVHEYLTFIFIINFIFLLLNIFLFLKKSLNFHKKKR